MIQRETTPRARVVRVVIEGAILLAAFVLLLVPALAAAARGETIRLRDAGTGSLLVKTDTPQEYRPLPTVSTDVDIRVSGIVARAKVTQQFRNPSSEWVEAVYVFPLPENSAVDRLRMRIGERVVEGEIKERAAARKTYEQAKAGGQRAGLIEQERANIFTSNVANIAPGEDIRIEIEYQQTLHYDQGVFRLRFPMVVGPRYIPGNTMVAGLSGTGWGINTDVVPDAARITPPVIRPGHPPVNPVTLRVEVASGFPVARIESPHHKVKVEPGENAAPVVTLAAGPVPADRDFELVWTPAADAAPQAAVLTKNGRGMFEGAYR